MTTCNQNIDIKSKILANMLYNGERQILKLYRNRIFWLPVCIVQDTCLQCKIVVHERMYVQKEDLKHKQAQVIFHVNFILDLDSWFTDT